MIIKKIGLMSAIILWCCSAIAQEKKVAVFDPAGDVTSSIKEIVREEISAVVVNTAGYTVLERQLINKVMEENKFQMGGLVDDSQISEIGKRMGASYVFVSSITSLGSNYHISCKMIEVQTARIEKQKTAQTKQGTTDLIEVTQTTVKSMFAETTIEEKQTPVVEKTEPVKSLSPNIILIADGLKVLSNGRVLTKNEVRTMMVNTDALNYYNKGRQKAKTGNALIVTGIILLCGSTSYIITAHEKFGEEEVGIANTIGGVMGGIGLGAGISGFVLRSKAKKDINQAVNIYNGRKNTSHVELGFRAMPNGMSLTVNF
jgi:hypothetical protein